MKTLIATPVMAAAILGLTAVSAPAQAAAAMAHAGLEVRFCPAQVAHPYPLDSLRSVHGLLLQNVAVINHGPPVRLEALEIDLLRAGEAVDSRTLSGPSLEASVKGGLAARDQGLFDLFGFQVCDGALLNGAPLADDAVLETGEALIVMQQPFAWKGGRDAVRVTARGTRSGQGVTGEGRIRLDGATSKTDFRFPLGRGTKLAAAGASFHSTHRWGVPEEFALDIVQLGPNLRTHTGAGEAHSDFFAYGAEVLAAADGKVAQIITGSSQKPPLLLGPGEAMEAYMGRVMAQQGENLAAGLPGIVGEGVILDHGNGEYSVYAHLVPGSVTVRQGQAIKAGDGLGRLGSSGNSTEAHLHFQVCDRPQALSCAGIVPTFAGISIANTDGPRPLQSGDLVVVP
ncbi:MAG: M23 family metallopeptidase [Caulobacter sp.]|nr:M23 family metallopeptidase [Caulobacter sp.]